jgi:hypothetical protein
MNDNKHDNNNIKKVLVLYYSQSGQLLEILNSALSPFKKSEKTELKIAEMK